MWKLSQIKQQVYDLWSSLLEVENCYHSYSSPTRDEEFKREIRKHGDLRKLATWRKSFAVLLAKFLADVSAEDGQFLIEIHLLKCSKREGWRDLLPLVLEQLAAIESTAMAIADGLRAIAKHGCGYEGTTIEDVRELLAYAQEKAIYPEQRRQQQPDRQLAAAAN